MYSGVWWHALISRSVWHWMVCTDSSPEQIFSSCCSPSIGSFTLLPSIMVLSLISWHVRLLSHANPPLPTLLPSPRPLPLNLPNRPANITTSLPKVTTSIKLVYLIMLTPSWSVSLPLLSALHLISPTQRSPPRNVSHLPHHRLRLSARPSPPLGARYVRCRGPHSCGFWFSG